MTVSNNIADKHYPTSSSTLPSSTFSTGFTIFEEKKSPKKENNIVRLEQREKIESKEMKEKNEKKESAVVSSFSIFQDEEKKDEGRFLLSSRTQDVCVGYENINKYGYNNKNENENDNIEMNVNKNKYGKEDNKSEEKEKESEVEVENEVEEGENCTLDDILTQMGILDSEDGTINTRLAR